MAMYYMPPPQVEHVRTMEDMQIGYPVDTPVDKIIEAANNVLNIYKSGDKAPNYNGVVFNAAYKKNRCQQNIRNLMEASFSRKWAEASCCAGNTQHNMHLASKTGKYIEIKDINKIQKGDIVYLGKGYRCPDCGRPTGHVMVYMGQNKNKEFLMWQNTTLDPDYLCIMPLIDEQRERFVAAYRIPVKLKPIKPINHPINAVKTVKHIENKKQDNDYNLIDVLSLNGFVLLPNENIYSVLDSLNKIKK